MTGSSPVGFEQAIAHVAARSTGGPLSRDLRVTLNFHPGRGVLERLAHDGVYRSQFETGTSNGGLTAHPGGARWEWESRLFGGAYDDAPPSDRPKYGALNHLGREHGGAPRFGSAHLRLREDVLDRTTFCYPDSVFDPVDFGTAQRFALLDLVDDRDPLDNYVEAHIHGPVTLDDVEALVLDPSFPDVDLPCPVERHAGFRLSTEDLLRHADYRTPESVALGLAIAQDGFIDPHILENADAAPQVVKHLWHHLARYGITCPGSRGAAGAGHPPASCGR
ncbi:DUF3626 domain-containing protein [Lentzea sp. BCCO 10_0856]|uniref:DUF3626 domain-containing protein n=1 Tax=Lentzea miocenica TaxID=3095431 RepID=A0ABU4SWQ1_9PSEU|nr:DUF3626 domain-containing protein [Lentzea sp. BCCO 10_0856]MDX8030349.1 DUF3626 domain-containing protein [Lentzea sp. BCCO 10_0856]